MAKSLKQTNREEKEMRMADLETKIFDGLRPDDEIAGLGELSTNGGIYVETEDGDYFELRIEKVVMTVAEQTS